MLTARTGGTAGALRGVDARGRSPGAGRTPALSALEAGTTSGGTGAAPRGARQASGNNNAIASD
jgi:hypothetical protein